MVRYCECGRKIKMFSASKSKIVGNMKNHHECDKCWRALLDALLTRWKP